MSNATWITIAVDKIEMEVIIVGFASTLDECKGHRDRVDTPYVKTFRIEDDLGICLNGWLLRCGMTSKDVVRAIRGIGHAVLNMMGEKTFVWEGDREDTEA